MKKSQEFGLRKRRGDLTFLEPGEARAFNVTIELTEDTARIDAFKARAVTLKVR
ncbi:MAG: hypothetical protein Q4C10_03595 [Clostridia bacterium]|nr:hypothetical protein [Clostridia bacterium]